MIAVIKCSYPESNSLQLPFVPHISKAIKPLQLPVIDDMPSWCAYFLYFHLNQSGFTSLPMIQRPYQARPSQSSRECPNQKFL